MAGVLGLVAVLQKECERSCGCSSIWRSERDVCTGYVVPAVGPVSGIGLVSAVYSHCALLTSGPITWLGNTVYHYASRFHLMPSGSVDVEAGGYAAVPGGARAEAERRRCVLVVLSLAPYSSVIVLSPCRAMALKALDQRLAGGSSTPASPQRPLQSNGTSRPAASSTSSLNSDASATKKPAGEADAAESGTSSGAAPN